MAYLVVFLIKGRQVGKGIINNESSGNLGSNGIIYLMPQCVKDQIKNKLAAFFHLGDKSASASVLTSASLYERPVIIWHQEVPFAGTHLDERQHLLKALTAVDEVAYALHQAWPQLSSTAHFVLPRPFYRPRSKIILLDETEPFTLDEQIFSTLREQEINEHLLAPKNVYHNIPQDKDVMLEYRLLHLLADDEEATIPFSRPVKKAEFHIYLSSGSEAITSRLKKMAIGHGHFERVNFHSDFFAKQAVAKELIRQGRGLRESYEVSPLLRDLPADYPLPEALFIAAVAKGD